MRKLLWRLKYVKETVPSDWLIDNELLKQHNIDFLVHGDDNFNNIDPDKLIIFPRTEDISSTDIRNSVKNLK